MALESFSGIWSLNRSNPTSADDINQGDDHIRGIKQSIRQSFPNISATVNVSHTSLNHLSGIDSNIKNNVDAISSSLQAEITRTDLLSASLAVEISRSDSFSQSLIDIRSNVDTISASLQAVISTASPVYGGLAIGSAGSIFSASASAMAFTGWDAGMPTNQMTIVTAAGSISPDVAGIYDVQVSFSFSGDASTQFNAVLYQDDVATNHGFSRLLGASSDIGAAGFGGLVSAAASSVLAVRIIATAGGDDFTPNFGQFKVHRIASF